jgi:hypothetical protein
MTDGIQISREDIKAGVQAGFASMNSPEGEAIITSAAELTRAGDAQAFFVPAVRLAIDCTLNVLEQPHIRNRLSPEIADRQTSASAIAGHFGTIFTKTGLITSLYSQHPQLRDLPVKDDDYESLGYTPYVESLGATPFYDARKVCGGALRLLQRNDIENPAAVIARSRNLLAITGIHKAFQLDAHEFLGDPYVFQRNLRLVTDETSHRVTFSQHAQRQLSRYMIEGRGCPAGRITPSDSAITLLESYWQRFVTFLVPPNATVNNT